MFTPVASVTFGPPAAEASDQFEQQDAILDYMETLRRNGQIIDEAVVGVIKGQVTAFVHLPEDAVWGPEFSTRYLERHTGNLIKWFGCVPTWCLISEIGLPPPRWQNSAWLFIYPTRDAGPALRDGLTMRSIPLYTVPLDADRKERLIFHARNMYRLEKLWFSGVLEMDVWRELVDPRSATVQEGRQLARELETVMQRPVYYWLQRYYGFPQEIERRRRCPGCNQAWTCAPMEENPLIQFQCHPCRLVSEIGTNDSDPPGERIGYPVEFLPMT